MAPDQMQLDFSASAEAARDVSSPPSASVHNLNAARRARQHAELGSVYQDIYESVKHVRLDRAASSQIEAPDTKG